MSSVLRRLLVRVVLVLLAVVAVAGPLIFIYSGAYDVAATRQHTTPVYWALITTLRRSIQAHAAREAPQPPDLGDPELVQKGLVLYDTYCVPCHGGPGIAPSPMGLGMTPPPPNLVPWGRDWAAREIYWTVTNGIKMTGMPAWEFRMTERERWAVVAFVKAMPAVSPSEYKAQRPKLVPASIRREGER